jgi:hypothetical protein
VEEAHSLERRVGDSRWSESTAVGSEGLVAMVKKQLGLRGKGRVLLFYKASVCKEFF